MKTLFELLAVGNIVDKKEVNWGYLSLLVEVDGDGYVILVEDSDSGVSVVESNQYSLSEARDIFADQR